MERRTFLKYFGSGVLGSAFTNLLSVRKKSVEYVYSYVTPQEGVIPGVANWYASVCRECPSGCGIHVKIREGRAKKIEGNPEFPVNYGRLCARGQAGLQSLYNPDAITKPMIKEEGGLKEIGWDEALKRLATRLKDASKSGKKNNVAFLSDPMRGNLSGLLATFFEALGTGEAYSYGIFSDESLKAANGLSFGLAEVPDYDIANARYVLSLGTGFLDTWASPVKHAVGYGQMRDRNTGHKGERGWLTQFEPRQSVSGAGADEWYPIKPGTEGLLALGMANVIVDEKLNDDSVDSELAAWKKALRPYGLDAVAKETGVDEKTIIKVARDFAKKSPAVAICGGKAAAQINGGFNAIAANILNHLVGSVGHDGGLRFSAPSFFNDRIEKSLAYNDLLELSDRMRKREVDVLFINNTNPVFTLPESSGFAAGVEDVPIVVSLSNVMDETTAMADLILPDATFLESWGDYVPLVDTGHKAIGLMQPVVLPSGTTLKTPLVRDRGDGRPQQPVTSPSDSTRQVGDVFLGLAKKLGGNVAAALPEETYVEYLKKAWLELYNDGRSRNVISQDTFEEFWDVALENGGWWEHDSEQIEPEKRPEPSILKGLEYKKATGGEGQDYHLELYPTSTAYDGRGANHAWLQQLPTPLVTTAWGTWAEINPETAEKLDVQEGDLLQLNTSAGSISVPAFIYPAIHPDTIAVPIGQGHTELGRFADGFGANPLMLVNQVDDLSGGLAWGSTVVGVSKNGGTQKVVKTDPITNQPGLVHGPRELDRHIVQWMSPEKAEEVAGHELDKPIKALPTRDLRKAPHFLSSLGLAKYRKSQYHDYDYRWGMVIDLDKCTGCSACTVACQAENNLPLMNATEMGKGRHLNWIRVDRYWEGEYPDIRAKVLPVNCYQCGNAPCEPVCPVYASYHTVDGLNGQVYPRCIGTRYCNAGCPYKARRFNWTRPEWPEPMNKQLNTDVTVRFSGVTEKCTFCVQRIREVKDRAKDEGRRVKDGEMQPACMQTCPSGAISFGDLTDLDTHVSKLTKNPRQYRLLEELNTEPAVVYLKAVKYGVHDLEEAEHGEDADGAADEHDEAADEHETVNDDHGAEEEESSSDEH